MKRLFLAGAFSVFSLGVPLEAQRAPESAELKLVGQIRERILSAAAKESGTKPPQAYSNIIPGTDVSYAMVPIAAGSFTMGSPPAEKGRREDEGPQVRVSLPAFWMGKHEVTWNEYELFMFAKDRGKTSGENVTDAVSRPTKPYVEMDFGMGRDGYPAICMTHHAASKYCEWLSAKTGHFYRLPTEAEWEYAARAGITSVYSFGDDPAQLGEHACFDVDKYEKVGRKKPNPWGLHDMHGNVTEWTLDQYLPDAYAKQKDGAVSPWVRSTRPYPHVVRGGSWADRPEHLRSAARRGSQPEWKEQDPQLPKSIWYHTDAEWVGFRIVRPLEIPSVDEMVRCWNSGVERDE